MIVGLTGGIGSGKSTVAGFFIALGVPVYNSDEEAKRLMTSSKKVKTEIIALLGKRAFSGKKLNKKYVAEKIFNNDELREALNSIVHPAVRRHFLSWSKKQKTPYVIQETALIFENSSEHLYDYIILVTAPKKKRIKRILKRDKITEQQVKSRFESQLDDDVKIPLADYVIDNTKLSETEKNVLQVHEALLKYSR